ncbi:MAG: hypothetical protein M1827_002010 [Pycnora praestabilis]|nr:MAG: hypothetical protein M1827_002010 [Pycnora praestabilis]
MEDDRPIALRRKRRSSTGKPQQPTGDAIAPGLMQNSDDQSLEDTESVDKPRKSSKRVRFSDPGPVIVETSSTGLTPSIRRTSLGPSPSSIKCSRKSIQQLSIPIDLPSPVPLCGELQFAPLRQTLDARVKRRLRRNHLSEEINEIVSEKRLATRQKHEVDDLSKEVHDRDAMVKELRNELEVTKQLGTEVGAAATQSSINDDDEVMMVQDNEFGIADGEYIMINGADSPTILLNRRGSSLTAAVASRHGESADAGTQVGSPNCSHQEELKFLQKELQIRDARLEKVDTDRYRWIAKLQSHVSIADLQDKHALEDAINQVLTSMIITESRAKEAEEAFAALRNEISALGFEDDGAEGVLKKIMESFRQARLDLEYLAPGEIVGGFDNGKLLSTIVDRIRILLRKVRHANEAVEKQEQQNSALRGQFNNTLCRLECLKNHNLEYQKTMAATTQKLKDANNRAVDLEKEVDEKERSTEKLQRALEGYREEVKSLENLIERMEGNHNTANEGLQRRVDEAVADLEGQIECEKSERQIVEAQLAEGKQTIEELEQRVSKALELVEQVRVETQNLLHIKEDTIATLQQSIFKKDEALLDSLVDKDAQLSSLREEVGSLTSALAEAHAIVATLETAKAAFEAQVHNEADHGTRAVENMQTEMMRSLARIGEVKNSYLRGTKLRSVNGKESDEDEIEERGPLTPNSVVRFADIVVENIRRKGSRGYDSGIGILEEEEGEEEPMSDNYSETCI